MHVLASASASKHTQLYTAQLVIVDGKFNMLEGVPA